LPGKNCKLLTQHQVFGEQDVENEFLASRASPLVVGAAFRAPEEGRTEKQAGSRSIVTGFDPCCAH
jgi:hypothetical protein